MNKSEKDLVKEVWEHRNDPEEWGEEAENIEVRSNPSSVVSFRLPSKEFTLLEQARAQTGESLSEFIRNALAMRLHGRPIESVVEVTYGGPKELVVYGVIPGPSTAASHAPKSRSMHLATND